MMYGAGIFRGAAPMCDRDRALDFTIPISKIVGSHSLSQTL